MKECTGNTAPEHPPPEKMRRENGVGAPLPSDFINNPFTTKYEFLGKKSTPTAVSDFECLAEIHGSHPQIGLFRERQPDGTVLGVVAPIPASWGVARSTRSAVPPPDGGPIERPSSLLPRFSSVDEALQIFRTLTQSGR